MTQDSSGSLKDTSIADSGKMGSALTLGMNRSMGEGGGGGEEGWLLGVEGGNRAGRQKSGMRKDEGKRKVEGMEGGRGEWRPD